MKDSKEPMKWMMTKEMASKWEQLHEAKRLVDEYYKGLIDRLAVEEQCPTICEISSSISMAMLQLHDIMVWLTDEVLQKCGGDFDVHLDASMDTSTELRAVKGSRCGGLGLAWEELDGKQFTKVMQKIREWLLTIGESC